MPPAVGRSRHVPFVGSGLHQTLAALAYAVQQHAGQRRTADGAPFVLHPIEVATLLADAGAPDHVVAAGVLHDTIEKTSTQPEDLRERFGAHVASLVVALSEDPAISGYTARKAALRDQVEAAGDEALMVFAADKVSKARELRMTFERAEDGGSARRGSRAYRKLAHYRHCADLLDGRLAESPLVSSLHDELAQLALVERRELVGAG
jgi:(p)ppGpp synthase/HD superfamily hydrolase